MRLDKSFHNKQFVFIKNKNIQKVKHLPKNFLRKNDFGVRSPKERKSERWITVKYTRRSQLVQNNVSSLRNIIN